ncbi:MAG: NADH-quinone oxidoreductase subunit A [Chloroflexi bacterium]|nr:NADH-quinone oxidoreductase subunit A [Chloroflexota bacterium]
MLQDYGYIALFVVAAVLFSLVAITIPVILRFIKVIPSKPDPVKLSTYECGMETIGKAWVQFNPRYYFYALVFLALDVLVVFLYPWAVGIRELGMAGFGLALLMVAIILVGYIYAWKKKVLEWK